MNLKKSIFGFGAAAALSLSMMTGAMAADASVSGGVVLAPGDCSVSISSANMNFGTWKYNSVTGKYVAPTDGSNVSTISGKLKGGTPQSGDKCNLTFKFGGLTGTTGTISTDSFSIEVPGVLQNMPLGNLATPNQLATGINAPGVPEGAGSVKLTLNEVPDNYAPGTYNGTIEVTIVGAA